MRVARWYVLGVSMAWVLAALGFARGENWYAPRVGEAHIDFVLPRIDNGEAVRLSQFRGRKVLLIQFASW